MSTAKRMSPSSTSEDATTRSDDRAAEAIPAAAHETGWKVILRTVLLFFALPAVVCYLLTLLPF